MAKRKTRRKAKSSNNTFMIFFIIIIVLAILSFAISYFVMQTESEAVENITKENVIKKENNNPAAVPLYDKNILEGTWASYNDGAMLTITGKNFTIELPSVDGTIAASGKIVIKGKTATFVYTNQDSGCGVRPGVYGFVFKSDDEISFRKVDDSCDSRNEQLSATWFRV